MGPAVEPEEEAGEEETGLEVEVAEAAPAPPPPPTRPGKKKRRKKGKDDEPEPDDAVGPSIGDSWLDELPDEVAEALEPRD